MTEDGASDYTRSSRSCDAKRIFMTFALLVIFAFIVQVLFRKGMDMRGEVEPGVNIDYKGYEGCEEI